MTEGTVTVPDGGPDPVESGTSYGFIAGILVAIVVIALLVYFLLLSPGSTTPANTAGGSPGSGDVTTPAPSAWHLLEVA
jgi:hypothetical protein